MVRGKEQGALGIAQIIALEDGKLRNWEGVKGRGMAQSARGIEKGA